MVLRYLLLMGRYDEAIKQHGKEKVRDDIEEMIDDSLASVALFAADYFGFSDLARKAAKVITVSGLYSKEAHALAEKYPWR